MRDYGKVHTSFWSSATISSLSDDARLLALYLMTSPHSTIAGVFRLPDGYVCEDLRWSSERVSKGFGELLANGFAQRCESTKWVWVVKHLTWNRPENPNQRTAASKCGLQVPDECSWKLDFMRVCGESLGFEPTKKSKGSATVPKPLLNQKQKQKQKQEEIFVLPDWIPVEQWQAFVDMRKAKGSRTPFTDAARDGIVQDLGKIRDAGHDVADALRRSVINGWSGVFEPKTLPVKAAANDLAELFRRGAA